MKSIFVAVLALSCLYMCADATDVKACPCESIITLSISIHLCFPSFSATRSLVPVEENNVEISNCVKGPCKLKRKTKVSINQKFTPSKLANKSLEEIDPHLSLCVIFQPRTSSPSRRPCTPRCSPCRYPSSVSTEPARVTTSLPRMAKPRWAVR